MTHRPDKAATDGLRAVSTAATGRMLEVDVNTDRTSVLDLLVQYKPVEGYLQRWQQQLDSRAWVAKRTAEILERGAAEVPGGYVDIDEVRWHGRCRCGRLLNIASA